MRDLPTDGRTAPSAESMASGGLIVRRTLSTDGLRVAMLTPVGGRVMAPGEQITLQAAMRSDACVFTWNVRLYSDARARGHAHYWYEQEEPYLTLTVSMPPVTVGPVGDDIEETFLICGDELLVGFNTVRVNVAAYGGVLGDETILLAEAEAAYVVEVDYLVDTGVVLPVAEWGLMAEHAVSSSAAVAREVDPSTVLPDILAVRGVDRAVRLDPLLVG